ncbi:MAG: right-handed parallel beta-helix repeat-containing protein [Nitrospinales bacterium]
MKIDPKKQISRDKEKPVSQKTLSTKLIFLFAFIFFVTLSVLVYTVTLNYFPTGIKSWVKAQANVYGYQQFHRKASLVDALIAVPGYLSAPSKLPHLRIDIKFKHLEKLRNKRDEALKAGILETSDDDFVPAQIRYGDRNIKVKLRLKGDWTDHLEGNKWSSRIHVSGKDHLFGMRRFSIQHPKVRGFQSEVLFFETLQKYGILAPRYFFVKVTLNGDDIGIMALEEHFSKELLEHNARKEGVVVKFDESLVWAATDGVNRGFGGVYDDVNNAHIDAFRSKKVNETPVLKHEYAVAVGLLRSFLADRVTASDVFDAQKLGGFIAVAEFYRALHAVRWHNLRFYLNPLSMKMEPIGFDGDVNHPSGSLKPLYKQEPIIEKIMADPKLFQSYQHVLKKIVTEYQSGELVEFLKAAEEDVLAQLRKEFIFLDHFNYDQLNNHINTIAREFKPSDIQFEKYPQHIFAYRIDENNTPNLELFNTLPFDVDVESMTWKDQDGNTFPFESPGLPSFPFTIEARQPFSNLNGFRLDNYQTPPVQNLELKIVSRIKGSMVQRIETAKQYYPLLASSVLPDMDIDELLKNNSFLYLHDPKTISVKKGEWVVTESIVVPKGYNLLVPEGVILRFDTSGALISYGKLDFKGTIDNPITLSGQNNKQAGEDGTWQGLSVMNADDRSTLSYTHILNTTGIHQGNWRLTGGVTFYKSDVTLTNCTLTGNKCEDAINVIHSNFEFDNILIKNCASDAFDSDFSAGKVSFGAFQDIGLAGGGDGIDLSGSNVVMNNCQFLHIGDKAISVGERSFLDAQGIEISDAGSAIVSKDGSRVTITSASIKESRVASLMTYIKKPEYGSAVLTAEKISIEGSQRNAIAQKGTELTLNGEKIKVEEIDVDNLYDTVMKPGLK